MPVNPFDFSGFSMWGAIYFLLSSVASDSPKYLLEMGAS